MWEEYQMVNQVLTPRRCPSPGRWHAALVLKMALVELLQKYDFRLEDEGARVKWWWETFQMPVEGTRVLLRRRGC